jgi:class 3 adenylate cyclase/tetratricopeptide (TPR) repeat protein
MQCPSCQTEVRDGAKFCDECGTRLAPKAAGEPTPVPAEREAERRQLTVMFCDLVGFTALTEQLDPEDLGALIKRYQTAATAAIEAVDGFVARYFGDGIMAYFGYPTAHEDAPERAVKAGLSIVEALRPLSESTGHELRVRVGIATGPVVVGDIVGQGASQEAQVMGVTPNLAARLQGLAEPGEVVISGRTGKLVRNAFDLDDRGKHSVKGIADPVRAWRAVRARGHAQRLNREEQHLVGREVELARLRRGWEDTQEGAGCLAVVVGAAGLGKSSLVAAFRQGLDAHTSIVVAGSPFEQNSPFHALSEGLGREQVEAALAGPSNRGEQLEALCSVILGRSAEATLLLVEDAHWVDASTLELLDALAGKIADQRLMILVTQRPVLSHAWPGSGASTIEIDLSRLSPDAARGLVGRIVGDLDSDVVETIVKRADGVPLYLEEIARAVAEQGSEGTRQLEIPDTLQDLLMARLDRLGASKPTAQLASTIGRVFSGALLQVVSELDASTLDRHLVSLVEASVIERVGSGEPTWTFHHALIRDAAYASLLRSRRQAIHRRIGEALEGDTFAADATPELLAHHFATGGVPARAVDEYARAAELARGRSGNVEACEHLRAALSALDDAGTSVSDAELRGLELRTELGTVLRIIDRPEDALEVLEEAASLAERLQRPADLSHALFLLGSVSYTLVQIEACVGYHERALVVAREADLPRHEVNAANGLGDAASLQGRWGTVLRAVERVYALASSRPGLEDVLETIHLGLAVALYYHCEFERAYDHGRQLEAGVVRHGKKRLQMIAEVVGMGQPLMELGRWEEASEHFARGLEWGRKLGSPIWEGQACSMLGLSRVMLGDRGGIEQIREGVRISREASPKFGAAWSLGTLARAATDPEERHRAIADAETYLEGKVIAHNRVRFPRMAADGCLLAGEWDEALRLVQRVEDFLEPEPVPWGDMTIRFTRDVVAHKRGDADMGLAAMRELRGELVALRWWRRVDLLDQLVPGLAD